MYVLSVDLLRDPHRRNLAGHQTDGHALWYRESSRTSRVCLRCGAAQPHCAYLFANRRGNRMKVLVHDGLGVWLSARRLHQGKFSWPSNRHGDQMELSSEQLQALVVGRPWQWLGSDGAIRNH
ncbi:IS66 family insertion sequence element accessory protein TnpB [Pseudomonas tolaasii]|uniref:IS66 family insertion sequence element accessory protein TnpB n=1 Tax=Pseudomonas tolaasii TaxID=29442 RepID=UPI0035317753